MKKVILTVVLSATAALTLSAPANAVDVPTTWSLLAAGERSAVLTATGYNLTTSNNGSSWYYNDKSMGFVKDGFCIEQDTADGADSWMNCDTVVGFNQESAQTRLSWHTTGTYPNLMMDDGWRVGTATHLSTNPEGAESIRAIYTADVRPTFYPSGPLPLVNSSSLTGWTLCWIGTYADRKVSLGDLWDNPECDGSYVMYAAYSPDYEWVGAVPTNSPATDLAETGFDAIVPAGIALAMVSGAALIGLRRRATS